MRTEPVTRFTELVETLGIPIHGVSGDDANARIDFKDEATTEQRSAARAEALRFDWSQKELRTVAEVEADVLTLLLTQRDALVTKMIAVFCIEHPRIAQSFGINVIKGVGT